jgi:hypothetical protein
MRAMTDAELEAHGETCLAVRSALSALRLSRCEDEASLRGATYGALAYGSGAASRRAGRMSRADDVAATAHDLRAFLGEPTTESDWPRIEENFYRDPETQEWVYRYADERLVLAVHHSQIIG